jgi:hypothetical protein
MGEMVHERRGLRRFRGRGNCNAGPALPLAQEQPQTPRRPLTHSPQSLSAMSSNLSPEVYTWLCGAFVSLGSVTLGYDLGIIASVIVSACFFSKSAWPGR